MNLDRRAFNLKKIVIIYRIVKYDTPSIKLFEYLHNNISIVIRFFCSEILKRMGIFFIELCPTNV